MQKQKDNLFREKFRLLNSQEHSEDIKWSSSSSSEYENTSYTEKFCNLDKTKNCKRKRKRKVPKNVSNLDITIIDSCKDSKTDLSIQKSPILVSKRATNPVSPILTSNRFAPNKEVDNTSPILSNKSFCPKSPILKLKSNSPHHTGKVRKKLSYEKKEISHKKDNGKSNTVTVAHIEDICDNKYVHKEDHEKRNNNIGNVIIKSESNSITTLSESDSSLKVNLIEKVKSFFDSHFSSENTSQNISDTPTPTDNSSLCVKNEEIDILSCRTQSATYIPPMKLESGTNSDISLFDKSTKKVKYKKGGLAYRLNVLLKKQNAHISLWQHERFLAGNSKFVIPKEENVMFRIQKVDFKYGCYLLDALDINCKRFLILINNKYVNTNIILDCVFKLYEPYKILSMDEDLNIIVNVSKFECVIIKE